MCGTLHGETRKWMLMGDSIWWFGEIGPLSAPGWLLVVIGGPGSLVTNSIIFSSTIFRFELFVSTNWNDVMPSRWSSACWTNRFNLADIFDYFNLLSAKPAFNSATGDSKSNLDLLS